MQDTGDPGGIVGSIRFKGAGAQGLFKGHLTVHALIDGVRLIAVGDDGFVAQNADRSIDDQAGVLQSGRIICLGADAVAIFHEDPVAAVLAPAHDKISGDCAGPVRRASDDDAAAGISVAGKFLFQG